MGADIPESDGEPGFIGEAAPGAGEPDFRAEDDFTGEELAGLRIAILGLGLMGGSLALALRGSGALLLGVDSDPQTCALALERGVVDQAATDPAQLLPQADLIVLAAPVGAILELLAQLPALHPGSPLVLDLGSTKSQIVGAMQRLPARFDPLGGHPMCGKERGGLAQAEAGLYQGATFALTALERTTDRARRLALSLVRAIGARPLWLDAQTHDRWVAATSHLPYLLAQALALAAPLEAAALAGTGFRSATRLAETPLSMIGDVLSSNRAEILHAIERLRGALDGLEAQLQSGDDLALDDDLRRSLARGAARRRYFARRGWLPSGVVPDGLRTADFVLRPLQEADNELDFAAMQDRWETQDWIGLTRESNRRALAEHARDHQAGLAFTFSVLSPDERQVLGCVYLRPLLHLLEDAGAPAVCFDELQGDEGALRFWLRDAGLDGGLPERMLAALLQWLQADWPFDLQRFFFHTNPQDARQQALYVAHGCRPRFQLDHPYGQFFSFPEFQP